MRLRPLGASGLLVSEIGFGCGGNAGLMVRGTTTEQRRAVAHALDCGVTYFDTAPDYGDGAAELALGLALAETGGRPVIATKAEIRAHDLADIAGHIVRSTEASLARLRREAVDVLMVHNAPSRDPEAPGPHGYARLALRHWFEADGALDGLDRLAARGLARHFGFVCRGGDADEVKQLLATGRFAVVNVAASLLNPSALRRFAPPLRFAPDHEGVVQVAASHGAGSAVFSPLAGGRLTEAGLAGALPHALSRTNDSAAPARGMAHAFAELARAHGVSLPSLAWKFLLADKSVSTVLAGVSSAEQLDAIAAAACTPLPAVAMPAIEAIWRS